MLIDIGDEPGNLLLHCFPGLLRFFLPNGLGDVVVVQRAEGKIETCGPDPSGSGNWLRYAEAVKCSNLID
jgi:hypothetical protein